MSPRSGDGVVLGCGVVAVAGVAVAVLAIGGVAPVVGVVGVVVAAVVVAVVARGRGVPVPFSALPFLLTALASWLLLVPLPPSLLGALAPEIAWRLDEARAILPADLAPARVLALEPAEAAFAGARALAAALLVVVVALAARGERGRARLGDALVAVTAVVVVTAVAHTLLALDGPWDRYFRSPAFIFAPLVNPNHNAKVIGALAVFCLAHAATRRHTPALVARIVGAVAVVVVVGTGSRGGVVAVVVAAGLVAAAAVGARAVAVVVAVVVAAGAAVVAGVVDVEKRALWAPALDRAVDFFPLGAGPGAFARVVVGGVDDDAVAGDVTFTHVENLLLDGLVSRGALALLLGVAFAIALARLARRPAARAPLAAIAVFVVGDLVDFSLELAAPLWLFAVLVGLASVDDDLARVGRRAFLVGVVATAALGAGLAARHLEHWHVVDDAIWATHSGPARTARLQAALAAHPGDPQRAYELAVDARLRKDLPAALRAANLAALLAPDQPGAHLEAARAFAALQKTRQALGEYRLAYAAAPHPRVIGEMAVRTDDVALRLWAVPPTSDALLAVGRVLRQEGRLDDAQAVIDDAARAVDASADAGRDAVDVALARDDVVGAVDRFAEFVGDVPVDEAEALLAARVWSRAAGVDDALLASRSWPPSPGLLNWRVDAALAAGRVSDARAALAEAEVLAREPKQRARHLQRAVRVARAAHDRRGARDALAELSLLSPGDAKVWFARAEAELDLGLVDDAAASVARLERLGARGPRLDALRARLR
jgi:tetratricopeptide (TPR) repeat protein